MKTFYDILKIKTNASDDEITEAYNKLEKKYRNDEEILKNITVAKNILLNPEARKNYDSKISEMLEAKKQNEIISNISNNTEKYNQKQQEKERREEEKRERVNQIKNKSTPVKENNELTDDEKEKQRKKEIRKQKRAEKKEKQRRKELYEEAYTRYLQSLGYTVKPRWTWKRVKRLIISIMILIIICLIAWIIPGSRNKLIELYQSNGIIKFFVDLVGAILRSNS